MKNIGLMVSTLKGGGAERIVSYLSQKLSINYNVYLFIFDSSDMDYSFKGHLIDLKIKNHYPGFKGKIYHFFKNIFLVKRLKKKYKLDVCLSFMEQENLLNIFTKNKEKTIICQQNFCSKSNYSKRGRLLNFLCSIFYCFTDLAVAVSEGVKSDLIHSFKVPGNKIKVIYNGVDIDLIRKMSNQPLTNDLKEIFSKPVIINIGRLFPQKAHRPLIRIFYHVLKIYPEYNLVIAGRGKNEKILKNLVAEFGIEQNVHFLGFNKNPFNLMRHSKLFVLSSLFEGLPLVLTEALACDLPIISTDCDSGPREILAPELKIKIKNKFFIGKYGIISPDFEKINKDNSLNLTDEENLLKDAIIFLIKNEDLQKRYIKLSQIRVREFDIDQIVKKYEELINDIF